MFVLAGIPLIISEGKTANLVEVDFSFTDNKVMASLVPILSAVIGLSLVVILATVFLGKVKSISGGGKRTKGREIILKNAAKRLEQNPRDAKALAELGALHYAEESWTEACKTYAALSDLGLQGPEGVEANVRWGTSALKLGRNDEAYKAFSTARVLSGNNFEVNYNLGLLEFQRKNYEKAIQLLGQAKTQHPENVAVLRTLGHAYFRVKKNKEAIGFIRKAIDIAPDDKESLFTLAECYHEANQTEQALRIFSHLRGDPAMGASACLSCGSISSDARQYEKAIQYFELGLRHENTKSDVRNDLRYRLAQAYLKINDIGKALVPLRSLYAEVPNYRDVSVLMGKYQELNANKNLQIYLMANSADFAALCRKIVMTYFPKARVKITKVAPNKNEWTDIVAEVDTPKWSDIIMFRFIRTQGSVGELILRDFHSHIKEAKVGKGICVSVGTFSEEARRYTEARLIDLIEKEKLSAILNTVDARAAMVKSGTPAKSAGKTTPKPAAMK